VSSAAHNHDQIEALHKTRKRAGAAPLCAAVCVCVCVRVRVCVCVVLLTPIQSAEVRSLRAHIWSIASLSFSHTHTVK